MNEEGEELLDIKPRVGPIPASERLQPSSEGKNMFKVELLVQGETMLPFKQDNYGTNLANDFYIGVPGLTFSIKVTLSRPGTAGVLYGARVYIDAARKVKNQADEISHAFREWSNDDHSSPDDPLVDTSQADHYFWMKEGQKEYIIHGFYVSPTESRSFEFAEPPKEVTAQPRGLSRVLENVGVIRIMFCCVEKFVEKKIGYRSHRPRKKPKQAAIDNGFDTKICLSAKPGSLIKDGVDRVRQAVLKRQIVFERRIRYNTYQGYGANLGFLNDLKRKVAFYQGLPLNILETQAGVLRLEAIRLFLSEVQTFRVEKAKKAKERARESTTATATSPAAAGSVVRDDEDEDFVPPREINDWVHVQDLVHYMNNNFSPAASYILCTGQAKDGNYGEKLIQKNKATEKQRLQDFATKERGLVAFFQQEPSYFTLEQKGVDETTDPPEEYVVKATVLTVQDSSSEEEDDQLILVF